MNRDLNKETLHQMYVVDGLSAETIAEKVGSSQSTVQRRLLEYGIPTRRPGARSGRHNHQWKGGRTMDNKGYILLHVPGHRLADDRGYVYEHRFVAEQELGRPLNPSEDVHHKNGDKADNRWCNLSVMDHGNHRSHHNAKPMPPEHVLRMWYCEELMTSVQIAKRIGVHNGTVISNLRALGIPIRGSNDLRQVNLPDDIAHDYQSMSLRQIAEKHGCSVATVRDSLARLGCQIRGTGKRGGRDNPLGPPEQTSSRAALGADGQASP